MNDEFEAGQDQMNDERKLRDEIWFRLFYWDCLRSKTNYVLDYTKQWLPLIAKINQGSCDEKELDRVRNYFFRKYRIIQPLLPSLTPYNLRTKRINYRKAEEVVKFLPLPIPVMCTSHFGLSDGIFNYQYKIKEMIVLPIKKTHMIQNANERSFFFSPASTEDLKNTRRLLFDIDLSYTNETLIYWLKRELQDWDKILKRLKVKRRTSSKSSPLTFLLGKGVVGGLSEKNSVTPIEIDLKYKPTPILKYFRKQLAGLRRKIIRQGKNKYLKRETDREHYDVYLSLREFYLAYKKEIKNNKRGDLKSAARAVWGKMNKYRGSRYHQALRMFRKAIDFIEKDEYMHVKS